MSVSVFDSKLVKPDDRMLAFELGDSLVFLEAIRDLIKSTYGDLAHEWKFYGQKSGWLLKLICKKRNVLFIVPFSGYFKAVFTLGDKATDEVLDSNLPGIIKHDVFTSKKYAEGRTVQLEIRNDEQCSHALELVRIKMKN